MTALLDLQRSFQAYVLGETAAAPVTVADAGSASAEDRLRVYSEAIRLRFLEVLGEDYPGLHALVGDDRFSALGGAYAAAHPSHHPSIRWFGRHLPAFLCANPPWRDHPVLGEMALFEWTKGELMDAADSPVIGIENIAAVPAQQWAGLRPRLKPAVRRLALQWNVPGLWSAIDHGDAPPPPAREGQAAQWLLWRDDIRVRWRSIEPDEAWALGQCADGADFGSICAGLCERVGEDAAALRAATCLKQWAADGLLRAV